MLVRENLDRHARVAHVAPFSHVSRFTHHDL